MPSQLNRTPMRDTIYENVLGLIRTGELAPGEIIHEDEIAVWLSVSRPPVREAMVKLEANGFIEGRAGARAMISEVSARDVAMRERMVVSLLCTAVEATLFPLSANDQSSIVQAAAEFNIAVAGPTGSEFEAIAEFDSRVIELADAPALNQSYHERLRPHLLRRTQYSASSPFAQRGPEFVSSMSDALVAGDQDAVLATLEKLRAQCVARLVDTTKSAVAGGQGGDS